MKTNTVKPKPNNSLSWFMDGHEYLAYASAHMSQAWTQDPLACVSAT